MVKDENVLDKYNKIRGKIKEKLNIKSPSIPVYDGTYIKVKLREFDGKVKTNFLRDGVPKKNMHYTCIACITIDPVIKIDKKIICKFIQKNANIEQKMQMSRFVNTELELDSVSDLEVESKCCH